MLACSRCEQRLPKANFTSKQLKAKAAVRFCIACTKGAGTLHQCFAMAGSTPAAERPSQVVSEKTVATTPAGQNVVVQMERLSTGGTRHEALYERPASGAMSDSQRAAKTRARTQLFPDKAAASREKDSGRKAAVRAAEREAAWRAIVAARRAEIDAKLPPDINFSKLQYHRRFMDEEYEKDGGIEGGLDGEPDGRDLCLECGADVVLIWLEDSNHYCSCCLAWLPRDQLRFACVTCDFDLCHVCSFRAPEWSNRALSQAAEREAVTDDTGVTCEYISDDDIDSVAAYRAALTERSVAECTAELRAELAGTARDPAKEDVAESGNRALLIDFYGNGSAQAHQAAAIMRDAGVSCRTLFSRAQLADSCGYNSAKWACMLHEMGPERFHGLTHEQASVVLEPAFIEEQNTKLGLSGVTEAKWLEPREIIKLATMDNPDGEGVVPWWLSCPAYDHFLDGFQHTISDGNHFRRGGLEIMIVNTDSAGQGGTHWFTVAWLIDPTPGPGGPA